MAQQSAAVAEGDFSAVRNLRPLMPADGELIARAEGAIDTANRDVLTPETFLKFQQCLHHMLEISSDKRSTATWINEKLLRDGSGRMYSDIYQACTFAKTSGAGRPAGNSGDSTPMPTEATKFSFPRATGRSTQFSNKVKSIGLCRMSGSRNSMLQSCHIISFSSRGEGRKIDCYRDLVGAMFGREALEALLSNVMNGGKDTDRNINRLDNGLSLSLACHGVWDAMKCYLAVDWLTYNEGTKEFDARFHWLGDPVSDVSNCWGEPIYVSPSGLKSWPPMEENDEIPFRHIELPS